MSRSKLVRFIFLLVFTSGFSSQFFVRGSQVKERRFERPDPLHHFKTYNGGYNVTNKHYWASAAFTGFHGFAIAVIWVVCGFVFLIFMLTCRKLNRNSSPRTDCLQNYCFSVFFLILLFTLLIIVATSVVLVANQRSLQRTNRLKRTIVKAGKEACKTIQKVTKAMIEMQYLLLPYDVGASTRLNITTHQLGKESKTIQHFSNNIGNSVGLAIQFSYISHMVGVSLNLLLLVTALVLRLLHCHHGLIIIILFCWIFTTICLVLTGFDSFFYTFVTDTCYVLEKFEQNPQNNSLTSIIPCVNSSYSDTALAEIGSNINYFITELNTKIKAEYNLVRLDEETEKLLQTGTICDPFSGSPNYMYAPENTPQDCVPIADLPNLLSRFTCYEDSSQEKCRSNGRFIPQSTYELVCAYSKGVQDMLTIYPDLQSLSECTIVKNTVSDIVLHQCKPLTVSIRMLWASTLSLSVIMMMLVVIWVVEAYQDKIGRF